MKKCNAFPRDKTRGLSVHKHHIPNTLPARVVPTITFSRHKVLPGLEVQSCTYINQASRKRSLRFECHHTPVGMPPRSEHARSIEELAKKKDIYKNFVAADPTNIPPNFVCCTNGPSVGSISMNRAVLACVGWSNDTKYHRLIKHFKVRCNNQLFLTVR